MNLVPSGIPNESAGNDPTVSVLDAPYAVVALAASTGVVPLLAGSYFFTYAGVAAVAPSHHLATFGGTVGDNVTFKAYQGLWYVTSNVGVTIS
jgi:hypothetical protein